MQAWIASYMQGSQELKTHFSLTMIIITNVDIKILATAGTPTKMLAQKDIDTAFRLDNITRRA